MGFQLGEMDQFLAWNGLPNNKEQQTRPREPKEITEGADHAQTAPPKEQIGIPLWLRSDPACDGSENPTPLPPSPNPWDQASPTMTLRPSRFWSLILSIMSQIAFSLLKVTISEPLDLPISQSLMIFDSKISPEMNPRIPIGRFQLKIATARKPHPRPHLRNDSSLLQESSTKLRRNLSPKDFSKYTKALPKDCNPPVDRQRCEEITEGL